MILRVCVGIGDRALATYDTTQEFLAVVATVATCTLSAVTTHSRRVKDTL